MQSLSDVSAMNVDYERDLVKKIVRESCLEQVAVKKTDTIISYSNKVYRELFYKDGICIGSRIVGIKDGKIVNFSGEISFDEDVYIYGLTCPQNTTALLKTDGGLGRLSLSFINDVFLQGTEDLPSGSNMLVKMGDNQYAELLFGTTAKTYDERR